MEEVSAYKAQQALAEIAEIAALWSRVNVGALCARAATLRNVACHVNPDHNPKNRLSVMGGLNFHVPLTFADGVAWICRIRQNNITSTPTAHTNSLILSEVATYRFLATKTKIPVPAVHDFAIDSPANPVGVGYILMDQLSGTPLTEHTLTDEQKRRVMEQMSDVYAQLSQHPFSKIGCLLNPDDLTAVGPVLEESTVDADADGNLLLLGPFESAREYRVALIQHQLDLILRRESYIKNRIDAHLIHRWLLDDVLERFSEPGPFFLKHMDDKGDHILVNAAFDIVGIIDWEWAQTTTPAEAFGAPVYLLDHPRYYSGDNNLGDDEVAFASLLAVRGEADLAGFINGGRVQHRLAHCITGGEPGNFEVLQTDFISLLRIILPPTEAPITWDQWRAGAWERYAQDSELQRLL